MKIKWCVSDIDGTIMNSKRCLPREIIDAVRRYEGRGGTFILATGRTMLSAREIAEELKISAPVITGNGSVIEDICGNILFFKNISAQDSKIAVEYAIERMFDFVAFSKSAVWHPRNSVRIEYYKRKNEEKKTGKISIFDFAHADELPHGDITKIFIWNMTPELSAEFDRDCNTGGLSCVQSVGGTLDVDPGGVTKGTGIRFLAQHLGINLENTAAFGDNINDMEMLKSVGFPVAVSNAEERLKSVAWEICPSNDECGVAYMLERFMKS